VKLPVTPELAAEIQCFGLVHHCEDCALFDAARSDGARCAHGYPTDEHERARQRRELVFCKEFEAA
jgi:hypothetical protein